MDYLPLYEPLQVGITDPANSVGHGPPLVGAWILAELPAEGREGGDLPSGDAALRPIRRGPQLMGMAAPLYYTADMGSNMRGRRGNGQSVSRSDKRSRFSSIGRLSAGT